MVHSILPPYNRSIVRPGCLDKKSSSPPPPPSFQPPTQLDRYNFQLTFRFLTQGYATRRPNHFGRRTGSWKLRIQFVRRSTMNIKSIRYKSILSCLVRCIRIITGFLGADIRLRSFPRRRSSRSWRDDSADWIGNYTSPNIVIRGLLTFIGYAGIVVARSTRIIANMRIQPCCNPWLRDKVEIVSPIRAKIRLTGFPLW